MKYNIDLTNKKALLIDCDGTLAETMSSHNKAYELAFILNNVPFSLEEHEKWAPYGGNTLIQKTITDKGFGHLADEIVHDKQSILPICLKKLIKPNKDLISLIKQHSNDIHVIVVSNGRRKSIQGITQELGIFYHLTDIITKEDYTSAKPSPEPYLLAMEKHGLKPEEVIVFEDNSIGQEAALAAGITDIIMVDTNEF